MSWRTFWTSKTPLLHNRKREIGAVLVLSALALLTTLGTGSLKNYDEAIYGEVAREMVENGDWLTTHWNFQIMIDKPPIQIWAIAASIEIFGPTEFAVRLPSAIAGIACVLAVYFMAHRLFGRSTAALSALVLLSIPHFFKYARAGNTDVMLTLFVALALYHFWLACEDPRRLRHYVWLGAFFGLAAMTKGAAAILIPGVAGCTLLVTGRFRRFLEWRWFLALGVFLLVAAPWHVQQYFAHHEEFMSDYVHHQFLSRLNETADAPTRDDPTYYLGHVLNRARPYSFFAIALFPFLLYHAIRKRSAPDGFVAAWALAVLVAFSVATTKQPWYIIPLYPAFAVCMARAALLVTQGRGLAAMQIGAVLALLGHFAFTTQMLIPDYTPDQKALGIHLRKNTPEGITVSLYMVRAPSVIFYSERRCLQYSADPDIKHPGYKNIPRLSESFFEAPATESLFVAARLKDRKHAKADIKRKEANPDAVLALPRHLKAKALLKDKKRYEPVPLSIEKQGNWTKKYGPIQLFRAQKKKPRNTPQGQGASAP